MEFPAHPSLRVKADVRRRRRGDACFFQPFQGAGIGPRRFPGHILQHQGGSGPKVVHFFPCQALPGRPPAQARAFSRKPGMSRQPSPHCLFKTAPPLRQGRGRRRQAKAGVKNPGDHGAPFAGKERAALRPGIQLLLPSNGQNAPPADDHGIGKLPLAPPDFSVKQKNVHTTILPVIVWTKTADFTKSAVQRRTGHPKTEN